LAFEGGDILEKMEKRSQEAENRREKEGGGRLEALDQVILNSVHEKAYFK